jgi:eukaryotic-like serine/threonine-protein kinase
MIAGRYELERPLGHGAFAVVDLARDTKLERSVALKRLAENLARDDEIRNRFLREGRLAARLAHPNVVRVFDVGEEDGRPFIAMEYVDGRTLAGIGPLPSEDAARLGVQLCRALAAVHDAGLVHRDVKPQNLLLGRDGALKLGDFGIAFGPEATRLTTAGTVLGTAAYLAPEQARGEEVTAAADIHAAGAVLYELLTGRPPRTPSSLAELGDTSAVPPPDGIPTALAAVVMQCLEADPAARPPSAAALARALATTLPDAETLVLPDDPSRRATEILAAGSSRRPSTRSLLVGAAVIAIAGGIAAAVATSGGSSPKPAPPARVSPVAPGANAEQQAENLSAWLDRYSR